MTAWCTRVITEIADRDKDIITELSAEKEELEERNPAQGEQEKLEQANRRWKKINLP